MLSLHLMTNAGSLIQTDKAVLEAQLAGAQQEAATGQPEAKAAREEAAHLAQQLEAAEQSKVPSGRIWRTPLCRQLHCQIVPMTTPSKGC